mmetsp:Transcript_12944/g.24451  ORF Transcript_12944/g.24451 Transcript_12944/m.24451 type:complete len:88 (-) Transcript_12944:137-400(-)
MTIAQMRGTSKCFCGPGLPKKKYKNDIVTGNSINHQPSCGGTDKVADSPNFPYAVLDKLSVIPVMATNAAAQTHTKLYSVALQILKL